jgi:glycosyltransferase involved in cell wall biosynthesis
VKVLHVDTGREWRGGQTQLLHLLTADRAAEVALPPDAPILARLVAMGVRTHPVAFRGALGGVAALRDVVRAVDPDLIAAQTSHAHGQALLAAQGRPVVVHRRVDFVPGTNPIDAWKYRSARRYVAVSAAVKAILVHAGVEADAIDVVRDGVDPGAFLAPATADARARHGLGGGPLVVAVGALVPHKGHVHLVDAIASMSGVQAVIAGTGALESPLRGRIASKRADVRLLGSVADIPSLLAAADVFVHPSVEEGMGQAVVEAMLAGVPVVVTGAGGLPEVVTHGRTGLIVPPRDPAALAAAIRAVLDDPGAAARRAAAAREDALARFGTDAMVSATAAAYRRALG